MWNSLSLPFVCEIHKLNEKEKNKQKNTPILVLKHKTKTKHTHLKRCLYYNHLPQPLKNLQPTEITTKEKPSWSSDWVKKFLEQDPNADDYDKYSLPLGREDTDEEIEEGTEDTEGIESTRLRYWRYWRYQIEDTLDMQAEARID